MKEETKTGFGIGIGIGIILSLMINLFLIYGGSPRGMFWRIDDNKKAIAKITKEGIFQSVFNDDIIDDLIDLKREVNYLSNHRHYGK